jgi:molecular chaperone HscC
MDDLVVGIDLGTTHSLVAVFGPDGPEVVAEDGQVLVPSVVALDDGGHVLVGHAAAERLARGLPDTAARFKGDMGSERRFPFAGGERDAVTLSAMVLRDLVRRLEGRGPIGTLVITVPAWFREPQRKATVEAAHLAGLRVDRLVNEPTAAALFHGLHLDDEPRTLAVFDLGGGTFDLTELELFDGVADVRGSVGDVQLGGEDLTDALAAWAARHLSVPPIDPLGRARLRVAAERAKRALSAHDATTLTFDETALPLDRAAFETLARPFRQRLERCCRQLMLQTGTRAYDAVLLVGGATRTPFVHDLVREVFDREPTTSAEVDHAVALGAAVQAALVAGHDAVAEKMVTDVLTHTLGVAVHRHVDGVVLADRMDPVLPRGTALPASRRSRYSTHHPEQSAVAIRVFEGEHRVATDNRELGTLRLEELPHSEGLHALEVRFTHDASGLLEVEAAIPALDRTVSAVIERAGRSYTVSEREETLALLERLKVHPRELLPNRWLVERASRVVELLTGGPREEITSLLDLFEAALERGDPVRIAQVREVLAASTAQRVAELGLEIE